MMHGDKVAPDPDSARGETLLSPIPSAGKKPVLDKFNEEIKKWTTRLRHESIAHREAAKLNKLWYFFFGFLPISMISATTSFVSQTNLVDKDMIVLLLSCTNALCAGVAAYWNWGELAEKHSNASKQLDLLLSEAYCVKYRMMESVSTPGNKICDTCGSNLGPRNQSAEWARFHTLSASYTKMKNDTPPLSAKLGRKVDADVTSAVGKVKSIDIESQHVVAATTGVREIPVGAASLPQHSFTGVLDAISGASLQYPDGAVSPAWLKSLGDGAGSFKNHLNEEAGKVQYVAEEVPAAARTVSADSVAASSQLTPDAPRKSGMTAAGQALDQATLDRLAQHGHDLKPHPPTTMVVENLQVYNSDVIA